MRGFASILLLLIYSSAISQDRYRWIDNRASSLEGVEKLILPEQDNEKLRIQYKFYSTQKTTSPRIFAQPLEVTVDTESHGTWESSMSGHVLWRQRISSPDAYSLSLGFTDFYLPPSSALFISDLERSFVIGPITQKDNDVHGEWWSPIIPSDEVVIELQIDEPELSELKLNLSQVNHDFSGLGSVVSGSCNLDAICGAEDGFEIIDNYRDVINSVGRLIVRGAVLCTGVLVNNTRNDCTPYMITANHCGITNSSAAGVLVYWNYQNSTCRQPDSQASGQPGDGSLAEFNSGSILRATFDQVDFTLFELDDPVDPELDPYYLGWDRETENVDTALTVHHPLGEEKRFSVDYDSLIFRIDDNFVRVADWDIGTTQSGSSGCPLFTTNKRLIGHLSGGDASCNNDLFDDFGMFKIAWEGGGTPETRLKDWLDPLDLGVTGLDGRYCRDVVVLDRTGLSLCQNTQPTDSVQLSVVTGFEDGARVSVLEASPGLQVELSSTQIQPGEKVQVRVTSAQAFAGTEGSVMIRVEGSQGDTELSFPVFVFTNVPRVPALEMPPHLSADLDFDIHFQWSGDAPSYQLEISRQADFQNIERTESDIRDTSIQLRGFSSTTIYYWRVLADNSCGQSVSGVFQFTTGTVECAVTTSTDGPFTIEQVPSIIQSTIEITRPGTIADVNVLNITGEHTWISDLTFTVTSPSGTRVRLVDSPCLDEDNYFVSFDDESDNINLDCPLTTGRSFRPVDPLSSFDGESALGTWTLLVEDNVRDDGGAHSEWSLELCLNQSGIKSYEVSPSTLEICDKELSDIQFNLTLNGDWSDPANPVISTGSGIAVSASVSPDPIGDAQEVSVNIEERTLLLGQQMITLTLSDQGELFTRDIPVIHTSDVNVPILESPQDQSDRVELLPQMMWKSGLTQEGFHRLVISDNMDLAEPVVYENVSDSEFQLQSDLNELTTYYWQVTALGECADSSSLIFSFTTDEKVATIDDYLSGILVYPSLVFNTVTIDLQDVIIEDLSYDLVTTSGQILKTNSITSRKSEIDVTSYSSGVYFLILRSNRGLSTRKIVIHF